MKERTSYPLAAGVGIATQQLSANNQMPNQSDLNAGLFESISQSLGPRPRGWRALASGLTKGIAHGERSKSLLERKDGMEKFNNVMNYLTEINQGAIQRQEWYDKRSQAQEKYMPQIMAYADNAGNMDAQSRKMMAETILNGWNKDTGDKYQLLSVDGTDPMLMAVADDKGQTAMLNIRDMFAGDKLMQERLAAQMPQNIMKLQGERQQRDYNNQLKERQLALLEKKYGGTESDPGNYMIDNGEQDWSSIPNKQVLSQELKGLNDRINSGRKIKEALINLDEMEKLVDKNKGVTSGATSIVSGVEDLLPEYLQRDKSRNYKEQMKKLGGLVAAPQIEALKNPTDESKRVILGTIPNAKQPYETQKVNINTKKKMFLRSIADSEYANYLKINRKIGSQEGFEKFIQENPIINVNGKEYNLLDAFNENRNSPIQNENNEQKQITQKKYKVRAPDGREVWVPESFIDAVIAEGGEVIQ